MKSLEQWLEDKGWTKEKLEQISSESYEKLIEKWSEEELGI